MDWFERLTGFREKEWAGTQAGLAVDGTRLRSRVNAASYEIGRFEMASLAELRARARAGSGSAGRPKVGIVQGNVREMHRDPANAGALFQVASQFNMLEMVGPSVTPEQGVTRYAGDPTQGPACAIAAGAATIWRNYFAPVDGEMGQTAKRQLDGLADVGDALCKAIGQPSLWKMRNGYAMPTSVTLDRIVLHLRALDDAAFDALRAKLRIGLHRDVEATESEDRPGPLVSQAFCSALPIRYCEGEIAPSAWEPFARLVLEATYEATLLEAVLNARRGASNIAYLTFVGGGAFGNKEAWIHDAIRRAVGLVSEHDLDIRLVSYGAPSATVKQLAAELR